MASDNTAAQDLYSDLKRISTLSSTSRSASAVAQLDAVIAKINDQSESSAIAILLAAARDPDGFAVWRALIERHFGDAGFGLRDGCGNTATHLAAYSQPPCSMQLVKSRGQAGDRFAERGQLGRRVIHWAAAGPGQLATVAWLLADQGPGCLMDADFAGDTPVHLVSNYQTGASLQLMKEAVSAAADSSIVDAWLRTPGQWRAGPVHSAVRNVDMSALRWLVKELGPGCLTELDCDGNSPLVVAASKQASPEWLAYMLHETGGDAAAQLLARGGRYGRSAVHWAACNKSGSACFAWLMNQLGAGRCLAETDGEGNTAVHLAAWCQPNAADWLQLMLDRVSAGGRRDNWSSVFLKSGHRGRTPVHWAACNSAASTKSPLIWLLSNIDAAVNCLSEPDEDGNSPLHLALSSSRCPVDILQAVVDRVTNKDQLDRLLLMRGQLNSTLAHCAGRNRSNGALALAWLTHRLGRDCLSDRDADENTPLHLAVYCHADAGTSLQTLFTDVGDNESLKMVGGLGSSLAHCAARNPTGASGLAWLVNRLGPECLLCPDADGNTPLHLAAEFQRSVESLALAASVLGEKENDPVGPGFDFARVPTGCSGRSLLHHAAMNSESNAAFVWLVERIGDDEARRQLLLQRDTFGNTPVHCAAEFQAAQWLRYIQLRLGGSECFALPGNRGRTALHCAALNAKDGGSAFHWLANELPADCLTVRDEQGNTPVDLLMSGGQVSDAVLAFLRSRFAEAGIN